MSASEQARLQRALEVAEQSYINALREHTELRSKLGSTLGRCGMTDHQRRIDGLGLSRGRTTPIERKRRSRHRAERRQCENMNTIRASLRSSYDRCLTAKLYLEKRRRDLDQEIRLNEIRGYSQTNLDRQTYVSQYGLDRAGTKFYDSAVKLQRQITAEAWNYYRSSPEPKTEEDAYRLALVFMDHQLFFLDEDELFNEINEEIITLTSRGLLTSDEEIFGDTIRVLRFILEERLGLQYGSFGGMQILKVFGDARRAGKFREWEAPPVGAGGHSPDDGGWSSGRPGGNGDPE